jgi:hypothetical protein
MIELVSLWLPILLSAALVFIVSSIIHMFLPYHRSDFRKVPSEDAVMDALRPFDIAPGDYVVPCAGSAEVMRSEQFKKKVATGPAIFMTVLPRGPLTMGKSLLLWFLYCITVSFVAAYIASRAVGADAPYLSVFRFIGAAAFSGYALALLQNSIWYRRNWGTTLKSMFDGLIYALVTAGVFGWLWPRG